MAHVSGPCSTLPGSRHHVPSGTMCDQHPDVPAVSRIQGETDSFGAEYDDLCQVCVDEHNAYLEGPKEPRECDWCKLNSTELRPRRDVEEGQCGRVYDVCPACIKKDNEYWAQECDALEEHDYEDAP